MLLSLIVIKTRIKNNNPKPIMPAKKVTKILIRRIIVSQWFLPANGQTKKGTRLPTALSELPATFRQQPLRHDDKTDARLYIAVDFLPYLIDQTIRVRQSNCYL